MTNSVAVALVLIEAVQFQFWVFVHHCENNEGGLIGAAIVDYVDGQYIGPEVFWNSIHHRAEGCSGIVGWDEDA